MEALLSLFEPSPAHGRQRRCDNIGKSYIDTYMTVDKGNSNINSNNKATGKPTADTKGRRKRRGRKNKIAPSSIEMTQPVSGWDENSMQANPSLFSADDLTIETEEDVMTWNHARGSHDVYGELTDVSDWDIDSRCWWDEATESNGNKQTQFEICDNSDSDGDCNMDCGNVIWLPPEPQAGNVEYKLQLLDISDARFERLVSQLKWRLREGGGRAIYVLGVRDSGAARGLLHSDVRRSLSVLEDMARRLNARARIVVARAVGNKRMVVEIEVVVLPPALRWCGTARVALLGANDAGKSTLAGVLTGGSLDNGRGRARLNVFRHVHEVRSGHTSSLSHAVLRYDSKGKPLYQSDAEPDRMVSLLDVAGHRKYLRTTTHGLTCWRPHAALLCLPMPSFSINGCLQGAEQHARLAIALNVPLIVAVTKCDASELSDYIVERVGQFLAEVGCSKEIHVIRTSEQAASEGALVRVNSNRVPVLAVSSVTGLGLSCLHSLLYGLPAAKARNDNGNKRNRKNGDEFQVDEVFTVGGRAVVAGLVSKGVVKAAQRSLLGPLDDGSFAPVIVTEVWCLGAPARGARAGHAASLALSLSDKLTTPRRGMVLVSQNDQEKPAPRGCITFQALIRVVQHSGDICRGFQAMLHADNVRQTVVVETVLGGALRAGGPARRIVLRLGSRPEYLVPGRRILLTAGPQTTAVGEITRINPC